MVDLNEQLGDKDAQILVLHTRFDNHMRSIDRTRQTLQNIIDSAPDLDPTISVQLHDLVSALSKK